MSAQPSESADQISFGQEVLRKATHTGALIIPAGYMLLDLSRLEMLAIMVPLTLLAILIDIARIRTWRLWTALAHKAFGRMIRKHEIDGDFTGAFYILISVCLTVALFSREIAVAALAFIMIGDSLAALVGRRLGKHRFGNKSVEGSLAFLIGTVPVIILVPDLALPVGIIGGVTATVTEAAPFGIDDNITVPLISGLAMHLAGRIVGAF